MMGVAGGIGLLVVALVVWWVTESAAHGKIGKNSAVGIRTSSTMASDGAWEAGHLAALPLARKMGVAGAVLGVALLVAGLVSSQEQPSGLIIALFTVGYLGVFIGVLLATRTANRGANVKAG